MQMNETAQHANAFAVPGTVGTEVAAAAWQPVCSLDAIVTDTGVCALIGREQVAVFRVQLRGAAADAGCPVIDAVDASGVAQTGGEALFAIGNVDPHSGASVLSRGVVGSLGERIVVASPLYKQHFDLRTGECIESPEHRVAAYRVALKDGQIWIAA
ncbi:nitrite reductase small subunit NirD [Robbsia andropogonis]|uniref:nitrite reductase small subunit NirD n=1 Tax=Robbsia andropogonis TaxID=28092 RepID=UPI003D1982D8